jgi:Xaa-Pro aminopeptidase
MSNFEALQPHMRERGIDGWLLYDFHGQNPTAQLSVGLSSGQHLTRRWFYLVPAQGEPRLLIHAIERHNFAPVPGTVEAFSSWESLKKGLGALLASRKRVAMEYCPMGTIPYLSRVDAGTIELVRSYGVEVVSSADLVQFHLSRWSQAKLESHKRAARAIDWAKDEAYRVVGEELRAGHQPTEIQIQGFLMERFAEKGLTTDHPPIVAVNAHAGNPHYSPSAAESLPIRRGDLLLIDLWAKEKAEGSVYADITWTAAVGSLANDAVAKVFDIVTRARDAGLAHVDRERKAGRKIEGCQVDKTVRAVIVDAGYGDKFIHRTGHNIGTEVHGDGANLDSMETIDTRELIPHSCFSIEPGIYLDAFGIRSEIDVYLSDTGAEVFSPIQRELVRIPA